MAKYYGEIGYGSTVDAGNGVYKQSVQTRNYYGEVTRNIHDYSASEYLNDNFNINNTLSIVADSFAIENYNRILYAEWLGAKWKVKSVEVQYPRLILSLGGVWNG